MQVGTIVGCAPGCHFDGVRSGTHDQSVLELLLLDVEPRLRSRFGASLPLVPAQRQFRGGSQERWRLRVLVQMHQNGLGCAPVVPVLMSMMSIHARKRVTCATVTAALMLVEAEVGVGLGPSAFWGSWCILGQTHETSHVDGTGARARLCIYLKESQADCRSRSSPGLMMMMEVPNGGSIWMVMIALVVSNEAVLVCWRVLLVDAGCSSRLWTALEAAIVEQPGVQMSAHRLRQQLVNEAT